MAANSSQCCVYVYLRKKSYNIVNSPIWRTDRSLWNNFNFLCKLTPLPSPLPIQSVYNLQRVHMHTVFPPTHLECWCKPLGPNGSNSGLGTPFFSVRYVTLFYVLKKECYFLFRSFLKFFATYGTQKNVTFFSDLF